jgi:hypothetical protein
MKKSYHLSWWSSMKTEQGCSEPPFQVWSSGCRRKGAGTPYERNDEALNALIETAAGDAESALTAMIKEYYPDAEMRFVEECAPDFHSGN